MYSVEENAHRIWLETLMLAAKIDQTYHYPPSPQPSRQHSENQKGDIPYWLIRGAHSWQSYIQNVTLQPYELYQNIVCYPQNNGSEAVAQLADILNIEPDGLRYVMFAEWNKEDELADSFFRILLQFIADKQGKRIAAAELKEEVDGRISEKEYYLNLPPAEHISVKSDLGYIAIRDDGMAAIGTRKVWQWLPFSGLHLAGMLLEIAPEPGALTLKVNNGSIALEELLPHHALPLAAKLKNRKEKDTLADWMEHHME